MSSQSQKTQYVAKTPDSEGLVHYTESEHAVWKTLYERQIAIIQNRACQSFIDGIKTLGFSADAIPQCVEVSQKLHEATGWGVHPVKALISFDDFFTLLANRKFPAATFIRIPEEIDYLKEPDIFHEFFGHCPMLVHPAFASFTQKIGELGTSMDKKDHAMLARLYWFTVEFGLINASEGLRIYGGGILSSKTETVYALESEIPKQKPLDLLTVLRTPYHYDELQRTYFIIDSFESLYGIVQEDLTEIFKEARTLGMFPDPHHTDTDTNDIRSC